MSYTVRALTTGATLDSLGGTTPFFPEDLSTRPIAQVSGRGAGFQRDGAGLFFGVYGDGSPVETGMPDGSNQVIHFELRASTLGAAVVGQQGLVEGSPGQWMAVRVVADGTLAAAPDGAPLDASLRAALVRDIAVGTALPVEFPVYATAADGSVYLGAQKPAGPVATLDTVSTVGAIAPHLARGARWAVEMSAGLWLVAQVG